MIIVKVLNPPPHPEEKAVNKPSSDQDQLLTTSRNLSPESTAGLYPTITPPIPHWSSIKRAGSLERVKSGEKVLSAPAFLRKSLFPKLVFIQ